ncbi:hypothetical protein [Burkholderia vietnamiensis]|uniref:hypothetical protein n=1 Tax=Burkholderia vietnamiensis TaxID=60552 RepID=UPI001CF50851|nr:hypothetical protein [Burkholderia vietnamiensis]MCA8270619.1 hypothetical protein [Burkholderia vietnamiensis]UKV76642.1 hypothetical protein FOC29_20130 [Burkholderia vietnamiensis]
MSKSPRPQWFNDQELSATRLLLESIISGAEVHKGVTKPQLCEKLHGSYTGDKAKERLRLPENVITYIEKNKYGRSRRMTQPVRWKLAQIAVDEGWLESLACPPGVAIDLWDRAIAAEATEAQYVRGKNSTTSEPWRLLEDVPEIERGKSAIKDFEHKRTLAKARMEKALASLEEVALWLERYTDPGSVDYLRNYEPESIFFEDRQIDHVEDGLDDLLDGLVTFINDGARLTEILDSTRFRETTSGLPAGSFEVTQEARKFLDACDPDNREFIGEDGPLPELPNDPDVRQFVANRFAEQNATDEARAFERTAWFAVCNGEDAAPSLPSRLASVQLQHLVDEWEHGTPRRFDEPRTERSSLMELTRRKFDRQLLASLLSTYVDVDPDEAVDRWQQIWAREFAPGSCHSFAIAAPRSCGNFSEDEC